MIPTSFSSVSLQRYYDTHPERKKDFTEAFSILCDFKGWDIADTASRLGVKRDTVLRLRGKRGGERFPREESVIAVLGAFGFLPEGVVGEEVAVQSALERFFAAAERYDEARQQFSEDLQRAMVARGFSFGGHPAVRQFTQAMMEAGWHPDCTLKANEQRVYQWLRKRTAKGFPALPDESCMALVFKVLGVEGGHFDDRLQAFRTMPVGVSDNFGRNLGLVLSLRHMSQKELVQKMMDAGWRSGNTPSTNQTYINGVIHQRHDDNHRYPVDEALMRHVFAALDIPGEGVQEQLHHFNGLLAAVPAAGMQPEASSPVAAAVAAAPAAAAEDEAQARAGRNMGDIGRLLALLKEKQVALGEAIEGKKVPFSRFTLQRKKLYDDIAMELSRDPRQGMVLTFSLRSQQGEAPSRESLAYYQEFREVVESFWTDSSTLQLGLRTRQPIFDQKQAAEAGQPCYVDRGEHPCISLSVTHAESSQLSEKIQAILANAKAIPARGAWRDR